ncbi:hypothetical protein F7725_017652, partial [Dissostichus mawsoni]
MKAFVLSIVYAESGDVTCGQARASKWHKLKKKSTVHLPPDDDSLDHHVERKNYIAYCQLLEHPSPIGHGWELVNGKCRPVRHTLPPLPQQLTYSQLTQSISKALLLCLLQHVHVHVLPRRAGDFQRNDSIYDE